MSASSGLIDPFFQAISKNNTEAVTKLLAAQSPEAQQEMLSKGQFRALMFAAESGYAEAAQTLLTMANDQTRQLMLANNTLYNAIQRAADCNQAETVRALLNRINPTAQQQILKHARGSLLRNAAFNGHIKTVRALLEVASLETRSFMLQANNYKALRNAAGNNHTKTTVELLFHAYLHPDNGVMYQKLINQLPKKRNDIDYQAVRLRYRSELVSSLMIKIQLEKHYRIPLELTSFMYNYTAENPVQSLLLTHYYSTTNTQKRVQFEQAMRTQIIPSNHAPNTNTTTLADASSHHSDASFFTATSPRFEIKAPSSYFETQQHALKAELDRALFNAAELGHAKAIFTLWAAASPKTQEQLSSDNVFYRLVQRAAECDRTETVRTLLNEVPLMIRQQILKHARGSLLRNAAFNGHVEIIRVLLEAASPDTIKFMLKANDYEAQKNAFENNHLEATALMNQAASRSTASPDSTLATTGLFAPRVISSETLEPSEPSPTPAC